MRWIFIPLFSVIFLFFLPFPSLAASKHPITVPSVSVSAQYIKVKNVVRIYFGSFKGVKSISYTLMYDASGVGQGVMGDIVIGKKTPLSKDIYLGTCSGKVCVPHRNIKNIQLEVVTKYTNGKSSSKTIKVK